MRTCVWLVATACSFAPRSASVASDGGGADDTPIDAGTWWNTSWTVRLPITIDNTSGSDLPMGFQIGVPFDLDGSPCSSSVGGYSDVRVVDGATELARVIDPVGPPEWTWFRLAAPLASGATSSGEYWLYCSNPSAPLVSDQGSAVFDFYDPFDVIDTTRWTVRNNISISNGMLVCSGNGADNGVVTAAIITADHHAVDFAAVLKTGTADWWGGFQTGTVDQAPWLTWWQDDTGAASPAYADSAGSTWSGSAYTQDTHEHLYSVEDYDSTTVFRLDDLVFQSAPYAPAQPPPASLGIRLWNNTDATGYDVSFDWVRLRQSTSPTAAVSVGSAEVQ